MTLIRFRSYMQLVNLSHCFCSFIMWTGLLATALFSDKVKIDGQGVYVILSIMSSLSFISTIGEVNKVFKE